MELGDWEPSDAVISYVLVEDEIELGDGEVSDALISYVLVVGKMELDDGKPFDPVISYSGITSKTQVLKVNEPFEDVVSHPIWSYQLSQESTTNFVKPTTRVGESNQRFEVQISHYHSDHISRPR
eukprot:TRINITY_DN2723_c0_g2_i1.p2 TRINITY_DN2723_c0_g2~~TRINITY_DN2723_c0_g2_i1.p2  ORF type:complete len:133 (+),score=17.20 TRINITY_DN2723_c0_g2_i1:27-401(+)